jgi:hypothetical protein
MNGLAFHVRAVVLAGIRALTQAPWPTRTNPALKGRAKKTKPFGLRTWPGAALPAMQPRAKPGVFDLFHMASS